MTSKRAPVILDVCKRCGVSIVGMGPYSLGSRLHCDPCYDVMEPVAPRGPGRPPLDATARVTRTIAVRLPEPLRARLDTHATDHGVSVGERRSTQPTAGLEFTGRSRAFAPARCA